jgi:hypothetical protein
MRAKELDAVFGIAGVLDFLETESGLVKAEISLGGIAGELYLQGAQVTAWQPPGERPILFTSPNAVFAPGKAVRGGIPIIFPWFGPNWRAPSAPQHGFAHRDVASRRGRDRGYRVADPDPRPRRQTMSARSSGQSRSMRFTP